MYATTLPTQACSVRWGTKKKTKTRNTDIARKAEYKIK